MVEIVLALILLAAFAVILAINFHGSRNRERYMPLVLIAPLFLLFKHSFVRQDSGHVLSFFGGYAFLAVALAMVARSRRAFRQFVCLGLFAAAAYTGVAQAHDKETAYERLATPECLALSRQIITFKATMSNAVARSERHLESETIADDTLESLISTNNTVDIVPWDASIIAANDYRWRPAPVFQHYSAYTDYLDGENARHYASTNAADILLCRFQAIDKRHMLWDTPRTWQNILANYSLAHSLSNRETAILKRLDNPVQSSPQFHSKTPIGANEWIPIPQTDECLFARIPLEYTFRGIVRKSFFRLPPVFIRVAFSDQSFASWRIVPDTSGNGLLMTYLPRNLEDLRKLLQGKASHKALALKIFGPGTRFCRLPHDITWVSTNLKVDYENAANLFPASDFHAQTGSIVKKEGCTV